MKKYFHQVNLRLTHSGELFDTGKVDFAVKENITKLDAVAICKKNKGRVDILNCITLQIPFNKRMVMNGNEKLLKNRPPCIQ